MTKKLQEAICIATTPRSNERLILNDPNALRNKSVYWISSDGYKCYIKLSSNDFDIFNMVACRCRTEFTQAGLISIK